MVWLITIFIVIGQLWLVHYHIKEIRKRDKKIDCLERDYSELYGSYVKLLFEKIDNIKEENT